jgi:hypothetical protein
MLTVDLRLPIICVAGNPSGIAAADKTSGSTLACCRYAPRSSHRREGYTLAGRPANQNEHDWHAGAFLLPMFKLEGYAL